MNGPLSCRQECHLVCCQLSRKPSLSSTFPPFAVIFIIRRTGASTSATLWRSISDWLNQLLNVSLLYDILQNILRWWDFPQSMFFRFPANVKRRLSFVLQKRLIVSFMSGLSADNCWSCYSFVKKIPFIIVIMIVNWQVTIIMFFWGCLGFRSRKDTKRCSTAQIVFKFIVF